MGNTNFSGYVLIKQCLKVNKKTFWGGYDLRWGYKMWVLASKKILAFYSFVGIFNIVKVNNLLNMICVRCWEVQVEFLRKIQTCGNHGQGKLRTLTGQ